MKSLLITLSLLCTLSAFGAEKNQKAELMPFYKAMAAEATSQESLFTRTDARDCHPNRPGHGDRESCVKAMCDQGGFNCSFSSNLEKVAQLCRGVEGECINTMCAQGGYNCSFSSNLEKVAGLCKNANGRCVKVACEMGGFNCSFSSNLDKVVGLCHDVSGSCVKEMCAQGAYNCSFSSNLEKVMGLCKR
jgi:hypothetical protein